MGDEHTRWRRLLVTITMPDGTAVVGMPEDALLVANALREGKPEPSGLVAHSEPTGWHGAKGVSAPRGGG